MKKFLIGTLLVVSSFLLGLLIYFLIVTKDRNPGFTIDLTVKDSPEGQIHAGFAALSITPEVPDRWNDINNDARYNPKDGDTYEDLNGNGKFDAVWMAGFQNSRPAQGIHDELWARVMVIGDNTSKIAIVSLDAIGFGADDAIAVRKSLPANLGITYTTITSTHTHEAPDLIGLWGESDFKSGVNQAYRNFVREQAKEAIILAVERMRPAKLRIAQDLIGAADLVEDSRPPYVMDEGIRLIQAVDIAADTTLGVLFNWANHPETLWNKNLLLTSDFVHYLRAGMEDGIFYGDSTVNKGLGGITVYVNGAIGGLMTTSPSFPVKDVFKDTLYTEPSFDKAAAQGYRLAQLGLRALADTPAVSIIEKSAIALRAKTVKLSMTNPLYRLASLFGILDRGYSGWMKIRTEVAFWQLGGISCLHYPGELYPEILNGGVEQPTGSDFGIAPFEVPPLRSLISGDFRFSVGLSNDMIGYIVPKSQWDKKAPFTYDYKDAPYGEINSVGAETSSVLYKAMTEIIQDLK
jgi:hypothetical protein